MSMPLSFLRKIFYRTKFKKLGKNTKIFGRITCIGKNIEIGNHSTLNEGVFLNGRDYLIIGEYCHISPYVQIHTGSLNTNQHYSQREHITKRVTINNGVWLCAGTIILPGVEIGEGSIIAAGSVVNENVPRFELWGGVPAKKIKSLDIK